MDKKLLEQKKALRQLLKLDFVLPEDIPDIDLQMDQVTTFMDQHMKNNLRHDDDKTLTKTMINNYTKNHLLPAPEKKKYGREHLILLIYIYYLKNVISISDIQKLLAPLVEGDATDRDLYDIYQATFEMEKSQYFNIEASAAKALQITEQKFASEEDEYLTKMQFIYLLGYDIYSKKRLIEKLIDEMPDLEGTSHAKKETKVSGKTEGKTASKKTKAVRTSRSEKSAVAEKRSSVKTAVEIRAEKRADDKKLQEKRLADKKRQERLNKARQAKLKETKETKETK